MSETFEKLQNKIDKSFCLFAKSIMSQKMIFIMSLAAFVFFCIFVYSDKSIFSCLAVGLVLSTICLLPTSLLTKNFTVFKKYLIQCGVAAVALIIGFLLFYNSSDYCVRAYYGIITAAFLYTVFAFIPKQNSNAYFSNVVKYVGFSALVSCILLFGFWLLEFIFVSLFLKISYMEKLLCCTLFFTFFFVFVNVFTCCIFSKRSDNSAGKTFKIIFLYVMFPLYTILIVLLYAYLAKALIVKELPRGQINWFVSFATCFYLIFYYTLQEYKESLPVKCFFKIGAFIVLPLVAVQCISFNVRIAAYGFTVMRYASLLYIIFSTAAILLTVVKNGAFAKWNLIILACVVLVALISPFNVVEATYKNQLGRLENVLRKNKMFDKELLDYNADEIEKNISNEERKILFNSFCCILNLQHSVPDWFGERDFLGTNRKVLFESIFGIKAESEDEERIVSLCYNKETFSFDIAGYNRMEVKKVSYYSQSSIVLEYFSKEVDITEYILSCKNSDSQLVFYPDENTVIYFSKLSYYYNKERQEFTSCNIDCVILQ